MKRLVDTTKITHEEWLRYRKMGISGTDAGSICGLNPYRSAMQVFIDKTTDTTEEIDNEAMKQGRDLEEYVAQRFCEMTGKKVRRANAIFSNDEYPWMLANFDRLIVGERTGLECKTVSAYGADKWRDGAVPMHYLLQCQHYLAVSGYDAWYIAALILGKEFIIRKIERDEELISDLIKIEKHFWENYVLAGVMPNPDGSKSADEFLSQYFGMAKKDSAIELVGFDARLERRDAIIQEVAKLQKEQSLIEQEIKMYMEDNETAVSDHYKVSWSNVDSTRFDTKRFKMEKPELYKEYAMTSTSRRFQIKAA